MEYNNITGATASFSSATRREALNACCSKKIEGARGGKRGFFFARAKRAVVVGGCYDSTRGGGGTLRFFLASEVSSVAAGSPGPHGSANDRGDFGARNQSALTPSADRFRANAARSPGTDRNSSVHCAPALTDDADRFRASGARSPGTDACGPGHPAATELASLAKKS